MIRPTDWVNWIRDRRQRRPMTSTVLCAAAGLLAAPTLDAHAQLTAPLPAPEDTPPSSPAPEPALVPLPRVTPSGSAPLFENVTLSPTSPDMTLRGISGGPQLASIVSGRQETDTGDCAGYVDSSADHRMVLTDFFEYLSLQVESPEDTTLVIRGPGGSWCSDDLNGRNPGVLGAWSPGAYDIWVGSYRPGDYSPYVIRLSTQPQASED